MEEDKSKIEEVFRKAIEMEIEGKEFYLKAAERVESVLAKRVFEELAQAEDLHIKKINEIYSHLKEEKPLKWVTSISEPAKLQKIFQESLVETATASKDELEALRFALDMEEKSIKYYEKLAHETENNREKRFYLTLSREERDHYLTILDSIEYLTDPVGWLQLHEKPGLEG